MYFPHVYVALTHVAILCLYILCLDDELCMLKSQINFCSVLFCSVYIKQQIGPSGEWDILRQIRNKQLKVNDHYFYLAIIK